MKPIRQHIVLLLTWTVVCLLPTFKATAAPLKPTFEAYQKVILGGAHAGFAIQRYTFDPKHKTVTSVSYTYVKAGSHKTIESLVAKATMSDFAPISYQYTAIVDGKPVIIDAKFANRKMTAVKIDGKKRTKIVAKVPADGFLSTFLNYVLLMPKNGLAVGKGYKFYALAEEKGKFLEGTANIVGKTKFQGVPAFKIKFHYETDFTSLLSDKGEAISTDSPAQDARTVIATKDAAIKGVQFNAGQIRKLFGNIPAGVTNQVYGSK